jgi:hypothetical protein
MVLTTIPVRFCAGARQTASATHRPDLSSPSVEGIGIGFLANLNQPHTSNMGPFARN